MAFHYASRGSVKTTNSSVSTTTKSMKKKPLIRDRTAAKSVSSSRAGKLQVRAALVRPLSDSNGTLSQRVYQALKKDIITGQYLPGEALSEKSLAKRYRGSRTPVREAAVRLQQEHLMKIVANRGYFITQITIQWVNEIYEFRAAVEGASAEVAAQKNWDQATLDRLAQLANTEHKVDDRASYVRFIEADTEFHNSIAQLTRNPLLIRAVADMRSQMERIMYASIDAGYYGELPVREHHGIVEAIQNRDAVLARKRMCDHIYISKDKVLRLASGNSRL
jgi:GntR family transcriptional regulator, rspAB operon transcriptional repressor